MYLEGEFVEGDASLGGSTKWSLRRVDCDLSVDTDGGGVGDCLEFDAGTDRLNPSDDVVTACNDGLDNDGDGVADSQDPGCSSPTDDNEHGTTQCDNGADDDGDGVADTGDPGCAGPADDDEHGTTQCDNGADDDGDLLTDMDDPDCPTPEWDLEAGCAGNQPPTDVEVSADPLNWRQGQDQTDPRVGVSYSATGSDPEGQNLTWVWRFVDSHGTEQTTAEMVAHQWDTSGSGKDRVATVTAVDPCGAQAANGLKLWISGDPVRDYAPTVGLYPGDPYKPMSTQRFINGSTLKYRGIKKGGKLTTVETDVKAAALGNGSYTVNQTLVPSDGKPREVATDDLVRPWDQGTSRRFW